MLILKDALLGGYMKVAGLLVLSLGIMLPPALCQTTESQPTIANETPLLYVASMTTPGGWKLFPSEVDDPGNAGFPPVAPATLTYATHVAPSAPTALSSLVQPERAKTQPKMTGWKLSLLALAAAHSADAATSWNKKELNPMLSPNSAAFGVQALALKCAITVVSIGVQALLLRRRPELAKAFGRINFMESGIIGATALHNSFVPRQ
jgi:hypothetical protein